MRISSMMWVVVVVCAASLLYSVKYRVQTMDSEIASIRQQITQERARIHVLNAEWAFLTRPERLRQLAEKHLHTEPLDGRHMLELVDVPYSPESPIHVVKGEGYPPQLAAPVTTPLPQFRPGVIPVGGAGYVQ